MNRPDMSRSNLMLIGGVALLATLSVGARFSPYVLRIPFHREIGLGLYGVAAFFALISVMLHVKRTSSPWRVSAASVSLSYLFFLLTAVAGIAVHRLGV